MIAPSLCPFWLLLKKYEVGQAHKHWWSVDTLPSRVGILAAQVCENNIDKWTSMQKHLPAIINWIKTAKTQRFFTQLRAVFERKRKSCASHPLCVMQPFKIMCLALILLWAVSLRVETSGANKLGKNLFNVGIKLPRGCVRWNRYRRRCKRTFRSGTARREVSRSHLWTEIGARSLCDVFALSQSDILDDS